MKIRIGLVVTVMTMALAASQAFGQNPLWQRTNGPGGAQINQIAMDSSGNVFAISNNVFRTTDNGATWVQLASQPSRMHVLPDGKLVATVNNTTAISTDHGDSWTSVLGAAGPIAVTVAGKLFVSTQQHVYRSVDDGAHWDTLEPSPTYGRFFAFKTGTLFMLAEDYRTSTYPFYRSTDDGSSWSKVINGITLNGAGGDDLAGIDGGILMYVCRWGRYLSLDDGRTWRSLAGSYNDIEVRVAASKLGYFAVINGAIDIYDATGTKVSTVGKPYNGINDLAAAADGSFWFAASPHVAKFDPMTKSLASFTIPTGSVTTLAAISSGDVIALSNTIVYTTSDGGTTWKAIASTNMSPISFDSAGGIIGANGGHVYRSTDNGVNWSQLGSTITYNISSIVVDASGFIYVGSGEGIFRSTDNGVTWDQLNAGLSIPAVRALAVNPSGVLFAAANASIFTSSDHALSWQLLGEIAHGDRVIGGDSTQNGDTVHETRPLNILALTINAAGDVLAAVADSGIYWSHDNGHTWSAIGSGLSGKVNALLSTPSGHVFAATDQGIYFLPSGGGSWVNASAGLGTLRILSIARDATGTVYLGTDGWGVYRSTQTYSRPNSGVLVTAVDKLIMHLYPNPAGLYSTIDFTLAANDNLTVDVINAIGVTVRAYTLGYLAAGDHTFRIQTDGLAAGAYRVIVRSGLSTSSVPLVVAP